MSSIRKQKKIRIQEHREKKTKGGNASVLPRKASLRLERFGRPFKRKASVANMDDGDIDMESNESLTNSSSRKLAKKLKSDSSLVRKPSLNHPSLSLPRDVSGIRDPVKRAKARKVTRTFQRKFNMHGKAGESDRHIHSKMPKHLFAGKRGSGKTDRR